MTRLADVTRPVEPAFFTPMIRPRVLQRIDAAAAGRIVLIVAPAGYGKSQALSQWLQQQSRAHFRFDVQPDDSTVLGFARGIAQALSPKFPDLLKTIGTAAQSSASAVKPALEMARWLAANIETFHGIIAVDDFHRATDPQTSVFLSALIARTKSRVQWVIATRSTLELPVASWLGYGDVHFIVGERDLIFSESETRELSGRAGEALPHASLREIMDVTAGWPVALSLALRTSGVIGGEKNLSVATREVLFQYLAEQVYAELDEEERELLHFACYLPEIRAGVLEAAGFPEPAKVLERVRRRATILTLTEPGSYDCHELFREFLRRQFETNDPAATRAVRAQAAKAVEQAGDAVAALRMYTTQHAYADIVRILSESGFDMLDHAHGDVVENALNALPYALRTSDPMLLGLRAQRESDLGHFNRAENLFQRAMEGCPSQETSIRFAISLSVMLCNQGRRIASLLLPLWHLVRNASERAEVAGLLAVDNALSGNHAAACSWIESTEEAIAELDSVETRAKSLLRLGIARMGVSREGADVIAILSEAAMVAESDGMFGTAARAYNVLGMAQLFYLRGPVETLRSATKASLAAAKSGDRVALHGALAYMITAQTCLGNDAVMNQMLVRLNDAAIAGSRSHRAVVLYTKATMAGWNGQFESAAALMSEMANEGYGYYGFDQIFNKATHALYCAAAGNYSLEHPEEIISPRCDELYPYGTEKRSIALVFLALAELFAGRPSKASRILGPPAQFPTMSTAIFSDVARCLIENKITIREVHASLQKVHAVGYGGVCRTIESCAKHLLMTPRAQKDLTPAERRVLSELGYGYRPKEIADRHGRSIHTIRTLIQRSIQKLGCSGREEAIAIGRRLGLVDTTRSPEEGAP